MEESLTADHHLKTIIHEHHTEKRGEAEHIEILTSAVEIPDYTEKDARRILWKIDCRLIPMLAWFYLLAFMDRGNRLYSLSIAR